ncbi:murG [Wigglesworthia glossinidia endosymbiont of Glossina brevipalpis]|uniref:UDP-N-acetylglucosamine--N-acetylmuramyl-(pentapeptide) pyrophosphoryl-undecaprenol N-acetylglucosamine transferase n=1 Tax=Wigglesworthia glossinidia brevipalpis TaxID=36870 RepID=MURG_WIGBR|nr:RecName: Full=UDP-N-acetylglucosamine--N-acetylmuramyl-(pentapeptide) pyrophosphoryl-undecaprenol N-acetylglucosamine transferase; AltName: Full=Undecaprenyl-PP-MurNAc-pentapeptide-UDPGlcNAc GlcNAc transferase [Wigglesworthia glossinidia endosymbiont of Glossina brevipalpis]BAC24352.1 murG [Wigglesworthia glossinidia endosymbiont of Glossina brevipalpis]
MKNTKIKIIITGGGSGGHVFVGLSIAEQLIKIGCEILWIGSSDRIESYLIPKSNIKIYKINVIGFNGNNIFLKLISLIKTAYSILKIKKLIKYYKPDIVLSIGGYVSFPGAIATWISKVPLIIHEQNSVPGLSNYILYKLTNCKILQAFPNTFPRAKVVGNPIRNAILKIKTPEKRFLGRFGPLRILVIGGSQGASILNLVIPDVAKYLPNKFHIWHQSGYSEYELVKSKYEKLFHHTEYKVFDFIKDISIAYEWADLIICRSGALTVSEISSIGIAALFVPYNHKDNHQYWNAKILEKIGAAEIINQKDFTKKKLIKLLSSWDRKKSLIMSQKSKNLSITNSAKKIIKEINNLIGLVK